MSFARLELTVLVPDRKLFCSTINYKVVIAQIDTPLEVELVVLAFLT